jgi:hypothetical protein
MTSPIEQIVEAFNKMFKYGLGKPTEGALVLNHNNVRDFLRTTLSTLLADERQRIIEGLEKTKLLEVEMPGSRYTLAYKQAVNSGVDRAINFIKEQRV